MRVVLAGGGTGGHLLPGFALAHAFRDADPDGALLFLGAKGGIEERLVPDSGFPGKLLEVDVLMGQGWVSRVASLLRLVRAAVAAGRVLRAFGTDLVVGLGGFASGPAVAAAAISGVPVVLKFGKKKTKQTYEVGILWTEIPKLVGFKGTPKQIQNKKIET